ncbi:MAG: GAF domain-containing protein [Polyangiaceae bacterium]|nr:GAF domain-containing protein [Polyangiaceae bacterium]
MKPPALPENEVKRLNALRRYGVLDSEAELVFDEFVELVARTFEVPVALISFVDEGRQWFKSRYGISASETPREVSFCGHVVADGVPLIVEDTREDVRFLDNPLVTGGPKIRFYAGAPLLTPEGYVLGTFCVIDQRPRTLRAEQLETLQLFARQVMRTLELRRQRIAAETYRRLFAAAQTFAAIVAPTGEILESNPVWGQHLRFSVGEISLLGWGGLVHADDVAGVKTALERVKSGESTGFDVRMLKKGEGFLWVSWSASHDPAENVTYLVGHDITERVRAAEGAQQSHALLACISEAQSCLIEQRDPGTWFQLLLEGLLRATGSSYGFIGEVVEGEAGKPYLKCHALSDVAWDEASREVYRGAATTGIAFRNLDNLFGRVITTRSAVIANEPSSDHRRGGLPPGHPPLKAFLGLPLFMGDALVGLLGVANREGGYSEELVAFLEPFLATCGTIIQAFRTQELRASAEKALQQSEERLRAVVDAAGDAIIAFDKEGNIQRANPATTRLFGRELAELLKSQVGSLLIDPRSDLGMEFLKHARPDDGLIGAPVELVGVRSDGSRFPAEVSFNNVEVGSQHSLVAVVRDISERKRVERLKSEFVSSVSHELRTPLTAIRGALGLLDGGVAGELAEGPREMVRMALMSARRLTRLVDDILDIGKVERGTLNFELSQVDVCDVAARAIADMRAIHSTTSVAFVLDAPEPCWCITDPERVLQVLTNLLSNAQKFSPAASTIEVRVTKKSGFVVTAVTDHGPGIPSEFQGRVFERFAQADASDERHVSGTGLGLSIAKAIVDQLGGRLDFRCTEGGTTFEFELPIGSVNNEAKG